MRRTTASTRPSASPRALFAVLTVAIALLGWGVGQLLFAPAVAAPVSILPAAKAPAKKTGSTRARSPERASEDDTAPINPLAKVPDSIWHPRPAGEWQGMLVDLSMRAACDTSSRCGLGLACLSDGQCGACSSDSQCATGEACVLDHCVPRENVTCRAAKDCGGEGAVCVLNGLTGGTPRGNEEMKSSCQTTTGGDDQTMDAYEAKRTARAQAPQQPRTVHPDDLWAALEAPTAK